MVLLHILNTEELPSYTVWLGKERGMHTGEKQENKTNQPVKHLSPKRSKLAWPFLVASDSSGHQRDWRP